MGDIIFISNVKWEYGFQENKDENSRYRHYGIDVGDNKVIHFLNYDFLGNKVDKVVISSKDEFSRGFKIKKCFKTSYKYSNEEIVQRAYKTLSSGFGTYDSVNNNCEHFVRYCVTGEKDNHNMFNDINKNKILTILHKEQLHI